MKKNLLCITFLCCSINANSANQKDFPKFESPDRVFEETKQKIDHEQKLKNKDIIEINKIEHAENYKQYHHGYKNKLLNHKDDQKKDKIVEVHRKEIILEKTKKNSTKDQKKMLNKYFKDKINQ